MDRTVTEPVRPEKKTFKLLRQSATRMIVTRARLDAPRRPAGRLGPPQCRLLFGGSASRDRDRGAYAESRRPVRVPATAVRPWRAAGPLQSQSRRSESVVLPEAG